MYHSGDSPILIHLPSHGMKPSTWRRTWVIILYLGTSASILSYTGFSNSTALFTFSLFCDIEMRREAWSVHVCMGKAAQCMEMLLLPSALITAACMELAQGWGVGSSYKAHLALGPCEGEEQSSCPSSEERVRAQSEEQWEKRTKTGPGWRHPYRMHNHDLRACAWMQAATQHARQAGSPVIANHGVARVQAPLSRAFHSPCSTQKRKQ